MNFLQEWKMIINKLEGEKIEFPTVPKTKKTPVWFSAIAHGDNIIIESAIKHRPSSKISIPRTLTYKNFQDIYPIYLKRENGQQVSTEATSITLNQVYYYSLIKHLVD